MKIIKNKKIFIAISSVLVLASLGLLIVVGIPFGIDFSGGALIEVNYTDARPELIALEKSVAELSLDEVRLQPTGETGLSVKVKTLNDENHSALLEKLTLDGEFSLKEVSSTIVGPSLGNELKKKAVIALLLVSVAIIFFIAYAFRKVSKPVSSWKYGFVAIITLLHDVIITTGAFIVIHLITGAQADALFVVALLTVLGLSVNDTIVVFDRVRENLMKDIASTFSEVVGKSLEQIMLRSINTSTTVIAALVALVALGPESTRIFSLTLAIGMFVGTFSSIFLASPLLVILARGK